MRRIGLSLVLACVLCYVARIQGQEGAVSQMYGSGVHAYFAGQNMQAYAQLSGAINGGSRDPRCFYFRGLTYLRLGRPTEAQSDFAQGAALEAEDTGSLFSVDRALERVQGRWRMAIEQHRAQAKSQVAAQFNAKRYQRVIQAQSAESEVLAQPLPPPGGAVPAELPPMENPTPIKPEVTDPTSGAFAGNGGARPQPARNVDPFAENIEPVPGQPARPVVNAPPAVPPPVANNTPANPAPPKPPTPAPPANNDPFAANPPAGNAPPANQPAGSDPTAGIQDGSGAGSAKAVGNLFKKVLGGLVPSVPQGALPPGLPFGGGAPAGNNQPAPPPAKPANDPFGQ